MYIFILFSKKIFITSFQQLMLFLGGWLRVGCSILSRYAILAGIREKRETLWQDYGKDNRADPPSLQPQRQPENTRFLGLLLHTRSCCPLSGSWSHTGHRVYFSCLPQWSVINNSQHSRNNICNKFSSATVLILEIVIDWPLHMRQT